MKRVLKWVGLATLVATEAAGGAVVSFLHMPSGFERRLAAIEAQAERMVSRGHVPGVMWAVVAPGEILATGSAGFADIDGDQQMTPGTIMPIGSISKVLVGLSAAIAVQEGQLDLEAPLDSYLTVPFDPPGGEQINFGHLATHTSGIVDSDAGYEAIGYHYGDTRHPISLPEFLSRYLSVTGDLYSDGNFGEWVPGTRYAYTNVGAGLAGQAVVDATGIPFDAFSLERIAYPLELSGFWGPIGPRTDDPIEQALLYERDSAGGFAPIEPYGLSTWPDGQFNASAQDLAKLMATLMNGGVWKGAQVLPAEAVALQQQPRVSGIAGKDLPGDYIGLFWERETLALGPLELNLLGHSGGDPGLSTFMYRVPNSQKGFVLMFNAEPSSTFGLLSLARMLRLLAGMPPHERI